MYELLESIDSPETLRGLDRKSLHKLAEELRRYIIRSVSQSGGHLSSNLGTVELTVALHYVFNTPYDRLVWDVGHQTYAHKILTGRREMMNLLRMKGGISGFPKRSESEYDSFGTGHSSTSISAALGMAVAAKIEGIERRSVAVIGDGAMTGGMAFEALNNAGTIDANLLVILNDNDMSISQNVGALNNYLAKLMSGRFYAAARKAGEKVLGVVPPVWELAKRAEEHVKGMVIPGTLFEEFGFNYIGPIDGHDLDVLVSTLTNISKLTGPQFLHVATKKGKGYSFAEEDPILYHGVSKFDAENGITESFSHRKTYTQIFGQWLCETAAKDQRLVGITPAMREGSGMVEFSEKFADRYFDVGIAEQHALTFAAGMACDGLKPVVAIYSTFLQRAYDQLIHDVAIQNLPVLFAIDRGGVVGADGATHSGNYDLSFIRCIPNMTVMTPSSADELKKMLDAGFGLDSPVAVRYPRGSAADSIAPDAPVEIGRGRIVRTGEKVAILAFGSMVGPAFEAGKEINATVADMRFVKPIDEELILDLSRTHGLLVSVEENCVMGGAGSAVVECLLKNGKSPALLQLGLPDVYLDQGDSSQILAECLLDSAGIARSIRRHLSE